MGLPKSCRWVVRLEGILQPRTWIRRSPVFFLLLVKFMGRQTTVMHRVWLEKLHGGMIDADHDGYNIKNFYSLCMEAICISYQFTNSMVCFRFTCCFNVYYRIEMNVTAAKMVNK
jgi:hypothetical protein